MDFDLSEEQRLLKDSVDRLMADRYDFESRQRFAKEPEHGVNEPPIGPDWAGPVAPTYFNWRKISIYGGSNEIQKNIIAKAILGL